MGCRLDTHAGVVTAAVCFLVLMTMVDYASTTHLTITPNNPTEFSKEDVQFSCFPGRDSKDMSEILLIEIWHDPIQKRIVTLAKATGVHVTGDSVRYQAQGLIRSKDVGKSHLDLTLQDPRVEDSGFYSCNIEYLDGVGNLVSSKYSSKLVVKQDDTIIKPVDLETMIESLQKRVEDLETSDKERAQEIAELGAIFKKQKVEMMQKYAKLESRVNYKSVFSATIKDTVTRLSVSSVIVFDDVILNEGEGYDERTGIFTTRRKGLYEFHLAMGVRSLNKGYTNVGLVVNGDVKVTLQMANFNADDNGWRSGSSEVSLVVVLSVGDRVKVSTDEDAAGSDEMVKDLCVFSGYLVRSYE